MNDTKNINSISTFFQISHYQYRIFDMGHKVYQLSNQYFQRIEEQKESYPTPFKQEAWLGILFWHPKSQHEPIIWFIHLPIDEIGLLKLDARDYFIQQTLEQIGKKITDTHTSHDYDLQEQSAFAFKPNQEKMAIFNAFTKKILNQAPSQYYPHVVNYLQGKLGYEQWSFLGIQGIADVIVRLDSEKNIQNHLVRSIPYLPTIPLITFGHMLEHTQPSFSLSAALLKRLETEITTDNPNYLLQAALIRSLSSAQLNKHSKHAISIVIEQEKEQNIEILAAIASRAWEELADKKLLKQFLEALATQSQKSFDGLLLGLMTIPAMQAVVRNELRNPEISQKLAEKTALFMKQLK